MVTTTYTSYEDYVTANPLVNRSSRGNDSPGGDILASRWLTSINVKALGAKGDGVTDDTAAFTQAAILGGHILVPPGTYLSGAVTFNLLTHLEGLGYPTLIVKDGVTSDFLTFAADGSVLKGVKIQGHDGTVLGSPPSEAQLVEFRKASGTQPIYDCAIEDCLLTGGKTALRFQAGVRTRVTNVDIFNTWQWGCVIDNGAQFTQIRGLRVFQSGTNEGIKFGYGGTIQQVHNVQISDCILYQCGRLNPAAHQEGLDMFVGPVDTVQISDVQIIRCGGGGIECKSETPEAIDGIVHNFTISDVIIEIDTPDGNGLDFHWGGSGARSGFPFTPLPPQANFLRGLTAKNIEIRYTGTLPHIGDAVIIAGWSDLTFDNINIFNCDTAYKISGAASTDATVRNLRIKGGTVRECHWGLQASNGTIENMTIMGWDCQSYGAPVMLGGGSGPNPITISAVAGNGLFTNLIRVTTTSAHSLYDGQYVNINGVGGTTEANNYWPVRVINATTVDLCGSTFTHAYTSGGYLASGEGQVIKAAFQGCRLKVINPLMNINTVSITGMTNDGTGLIKVTAPSHGQVSGAYINISLQTGQAAATGYWFIQVVDLNNFILLSSVYNSADPYVSGGSVKPPSVVGFRASEAHNLSIEDCNISGIQEGVSMLTNTGTGTARTSGGLIRRCTVSSTLKAAIRCDEGIWEITGNTVTCGLGFNGVSGAGTILAADNLRGFSDVDPTGVFHGGIGEYLANPTLGAGGTDPTDVYRWVSIGGTTWKPIKIGA
jgi:hypothetical protein